jgi:hypothetical protein
MSSIDTGFQLIVSDPYERVLSGRRNSSNSKDAVILDSSCVCLSVDVSKLIFHRYTKEELEAVTVDHRNPGNMSDRVALAAVRLLRWGADLAMGYRHADAQKLASMDPVLAEKKYGMTERKYMIRNIFLESVAGVPGMVAGMMRHLRSMRLMRRDNGWMETLLEEA